MPSRTEDAIRFNDEGDEPPLLPPDHPDAPKFWMHETTGVLRPVIEAYLEGHNLSDGEIRIFRAYLQQWFRSPVWGSSSELNALRRRIDRISSRADVSICLRVAMMMGIDPL